MASSNSTASFTAVNDGEFSHLDLTGKLIIKVSFGEDIRRIPIHNEEITYDELILMMQRVFRGQLDANDDVVIKYKDEDNDLITIADSSDLSFAIQCSRILKITLFVNGQPLPLMTDEVKVIRKELQHIRNRCNILLDRLEAPRKASTATGAADEDSSVATDKTVDTAAGRRSAPSVGQPLNKEFDPLKSFGGRQELHNGLQESSDKRSATPDSVSSLSSQSRQQQGLGNVSAPELKSLVGGDPNLSPGGQPQQSYGNQLMGGQGFPQQPQPPARFEVQAQPYPGQFPPPNRQNPGLPGGPGGLPLQNPQSSPLGPPPPTSQGIGGGYPGGPPSQPQSMSGFGGPQGPPNQPFGAPPPAGRPPGQFGAPPPSGQLGGPGGPPPQSMFPQMSGPPPTSMAPTGPTPGGPGGPPQSGYGQPSPIHGYGGGPQPPVSQQQQQQQQQQYQQQMPSQQPPQQSMAGPYPGGMGGPPPPSMSMGGSMPGPPPTLMSGPMPGGMNPYSRGVGTNRPRYPPNPGFPVPQ